MIREKREKEAKKIKVQLLKIIIISIDVIGIFIGVIKIFIGIVTVVAIIIIYPREQEEKIRRMAMEMKEKRARQERSKYR